MTVFSLKCCKTQRFLLKKVAEICEQENDYQEGVLQSALRVMTAASKVYASDQIFKGAAVIS